MRPQERQAPRSYRFDAKGNLLLATPLRWFTWAGRACTELKLATLPEIERIADGYLRAAAGDELSRRRPNSASICTDAKKGWEPILFVDSPYRA